MRLIIRPSKNCPIKKPSFSSEPVVFCLELITESELADTELKALIETRNRRTERVFLVGVELKSRQGWETDDSLDELSELAVTAGAEVVGDGFQKLAAPCASTFI